MALVELLNGSWVTDGGWETDLIFNMEELDAGDMPLLVSTTRKLREELPSIAVLGGCCGTDSRHVAALWDVDSIR